MHRDQRHRQSARSRRPPRMLVDPSPLIALDDQLASASAADFARAQPTCQAAERPHPHRADRSRASAVQSLRPERTATQSTPLQATVETSERHHARFTCNTLTRLIENEGANTSPREDGQSAQVYARPTARHKILANTIARSTAARIRFNELSTTAGAQLTGSEKRVSLGGFREKRATAATCSSSCPRVIHRDDGLSRIRFQLLRFVDRNVVRHRTNRRALRSRGPQLRSRLQANVSEG
jgi:hypothetical protein